MKRREESYECAVCGREHVHEVEQYLFDASDIEPGGTYENGPVTLILEDYVDWHDEVADGYTKVDQFWDTDANAIVIEVIEQV